MTSEDRPRRPRKVGRPYKYGFILEQLDPNKLYAATCIARLAHRCGYLKRIISPREQTLTQHRIRLAMIHISKRRGFPKGGDGNVSIPGQCPIFAWFGWRWQSILPIVIDDGGGEENGPILPRCIFRWVSQSLTESHYSRAGVVMLAKSLGWVKPAHLHHFHADLRWLMKKAGFNEDRPDILAHLDGGALPVPGFGQDRWACGLMRAAGPAPRCRFSFLVERTKDEDLHHAGTLAKLLKVRDLKKLRSKKSLTSNQDKAYVAFSRIRLKHITVPPDGNLPSPRAPSTRAWRGEVWKSALEIPGYYGMHQREFLLYIEHEAL